MRPIALILCALTALASSSVRVAAGQAPARSETGLFATDDVLEFAIEAPFERLFSKGRQDSDYSVEGTLKYTEGARQSVIAGIEISTRGHTSRRETECDYPKLKLKFGNRSRTEGSPFDGVTTVKIGTHCGERADADLTVPFGRWANEKAAHREAFVYRLLNTLEVPTLLSRPARITYVFRDGVNSGAPLVRNALLVEDDDAAMRRLGATRQIAPETPSPGTAPRCRGCYAAHVGSAHCHVNAVRNNVVSGCESADIRPEVFVAATADIGLACEEREPSGDRVDQPGQRRRCCCFVLRGNTRSRPGRIRLAVRRGSPSARRGTLSCQSPASALLIDCAGDKRTPIIEGS